MQWSIADCLFELAQMDEVLWLTAYQQQSQQPLEQIRTHLDQVQPFASPSQKPISPTSYRRWLRNDFYTLENIGAIQKVSGTKKFQKSEILPHPLTAHPVASPLRDSACPDTTIQSLELSQMWDRYRAPIQNVQRLFLYLDYVVSEQGNDQVFAWQTFLYENVWTQTPVPLIQFDYDSRSLQERFSVITYPIALYYAQRAPYLCGYGEDPTCRMEGLTYYNFRLDRMYNPQVIPWTDLRSNSLAIASQLFNAYLNQALPTPEQVQQAQEEAWGFDMGLPQQAMILRFPRSFHQGYIQDSDRHETFQPLLSTENGLNVQSFNAFCRESQSRGCPLSQTDQHRVLSRCADHPEDAFYRAFYREGDTNIMMRLRAWGPRVEVIYPFSLQTKIRQELQAAIAMYPE
jgi:CRISPR-associated protein (TIGR03985 family)